MNVKFPKTDDSNSAESKPVLKSTRALAGKTMPCLMVALSCLLAAGCQDKDQGDGADGGDDADTTTYVDSDSDVDTQTDIGADVDSDADTDMDTDADTGSDSATDPDDRPWILGYYVGYLSSLYTPQEIDFDHLTHIAMGAVLPNADGTIETSFYLDAASGTKLARDVATRAHAADVTPILMIGGAGTIGGFRGAASETNRAAFVANLLSAMDDLGYDGLDLDWEPIAVEDEQVLLALVQELRVERPDIVLTMPVNWINANAPNLSSFYTDVAPLLDQVNIMSYVMAGAWTGWQVWHSSALKGHSPTMPSSVQSSAEAYLAAGIPAAKIGVGAGFFGQCWSGGVTGPGQGTSGSRIGAVDTKMSYTMIIEDYYDPQAAQYDTDAEAPYLSFTTPRGDSECTFISYEDPESLTAKANYIKQNNLGGIIIWTINQGYLPGASEEARNPLLQAIANTL